MIDFRNDIIRNEIPENESPNKIVDIVDKKGKEIKLFTPKKLLQKLPIVEIKTQ